VSPYRSPTPYLNLIPYTCIAEAAKASIVARPKPKGSSVRSGKDGLGCRDVGEDLGVLIFFVKR
jgi:hypothetical protein